MCSSDRMPLLRQVDGFPIEIDGRRMFCLRDPEGFATRPVVLTPEAFVLATLLDGEHSTRDLQVECMQRFNRLVYTDTIEGMINTLDEAYLLENDRFAARCAAVLDEFGAQRVRRPTHAGDGYPEDRDELRARLDGYFVAENGPGTAGPPGQDPCACAVVAPHIDLDRGGICYAFAYKELIERCPAETFIVLGTCHTDMDRPFALTRKDFGTPFGDLPTDQDAVDRLVDAVGPDLFDDEIVHRAEHTIEFQTLFIQHAFAGRRTVRIVPVLCGTYPGLVDGPGDSPQSTMAHRTIEALGEIVRDMGDRAAVIASADLSHVGPRFGDAGRVSQTTLVSLKSADLRTLETVETVDPAAFLDDVRRDGNRRHICGIPPIHALLAIVPPCRCRLLRYDQWPDPDATVTFASMVFDRVD